MVQEIIIIGAGASGLLAAITAARKGCKVLVIEQKEKAGKKILATGNGKCNYTNLYQAPECYRSEDSAFVTKVLSNFDVQKTVCFFEELGIYPRERNGYLYPNSEQAASVVQVLLMECERLGVSFRYEEKVKEIKVLNPELKNRDSKNKEKPGTAAGTGGFRIITDKLTDEQGDYLTEKLILAAGGCASPKLGSDGSGYILATSLGHQLIKPLPALVQLKSPDKFCKTLSGVRTTGKVTAYAETGKLSEEEGELIFADYGISGIPILQLSRYVARALDQKKKVHLSIDYMPQNHKSAILELLQSRVSFSGNKNLEEMMVGLFNHKLSYILIKEAGLDPYQSCQSIRGKELELLTAQIKDFKIRISETNSFENAQVCCGGIPTKELEADTLESKLVQNLYLCGELVDVDGTCGGYNLQWAWSSGYLAGTSAAAR